MGYERDEAMRQQDATAEMIRMRQPDVNAALDKLGATTNRIADERNAFKREAEALRGRFAMLEDVLEEIKEYLADREDADHDGERFIPNKEMSLLIALRRAMGEDL